MFTVGRTHIKHSITGIIIRLIVDLIFFIFFLKHGKEHSWTPCTLHTSVTDVIFQSCLWIFVSMQLPRRTHSTKWLSYTLLYKMASKTSKFLCYRATGIFNLEFFKDHDIGESVRRKKISRSRIQFFASVPLKTTRFGS